TYNKFEIECYDVATKRLKRTITPKSDDTKQPITDSGIYNAVAPDGSAFSSLTHGQHIYDGKTGEVVWQVPEPLVGITNGFIPGGTRYLAHVRDQGEKNNFLPTVVVWDWKTGKGVAALPGFAPNQIDILATASADGKTVVAASEKGEVLVFDISSVK